MALLQITVDDNDYARLTVRAAALGKPVEVLLRDLIHDYARPMTLEEAYKPIQEATADRDDGRGNPRTP